jgi:phage baseplate assembly protein W
MHLLLTRKGERLYLPDFGTDLLKYIFEFNDGATRGDISKELNEVIKKYIPNLIINSVDVTESEDSEHAVVGRIDYTVTEDTFEEKDFILLQI